VLNLIIPKYQRKKFLSIKIKEFFFSRSIGIRIGDDLQLQIAVRKRRESNDDTIMDDDSNERTTRSKGIKYDSINLEDYCGTSTLQKFEMFIASLLHEEKQQ
jgi:hypothetical protein